MRKGQTCANCAAFAALEQECRRNAPTALPIQQANGTMAKVGLFPGTSKNGWCLQWESDEPMPGQLGVR